MRIRNLFVACALLAACSGAEQPPTTVTFDNEADQILFGLSLTITSDGVMRAGIEADTAFQYEARQLSELRGLTVYFYNSVGERTSTLTSREGTYNWRSEDMEARGNVVAVTPDQRRLTTESLIYTRAIHKISGSQPFVFDSPDQHLTGESFTSDPDFKNVVAVHPSGTLGRLDSDR